MFLSPNLFNLISNEFCLFLCSNFIDSIYKVLFFWVCTAIYTYKLSLRWIIIMNENVKNIIFRKLEWKKVLNIVFIQKGLKGVYVEFNLHIWDE